MQPFSFAHRIPLVFSLPLALLFSPLAAASTTMDIALSLASHPNSLQGRLDDYHRCRLRVGGQPEATSLPEGASADNCQAEVDALRAFMPEALFVQVISTPDDPGAP